VRSKLVLVLVVLGLVITGIPASHAKGKLKSLTLAMPAGYGSDRHTYAFSYKSGRAGKLTKISDETHIEQFTGRYLVSYESFAYTSNIEDIKRHTSVGENLIYSDRAAVGIVNNVAYYRIADNNGVSMSGFVKRLSNGDVADMATLKFSNPRGFQYWYDDQSVPRNSRYLYLGMNLSSIPDELGNTDYVGFGIYRQGQTGVRFWKKIADDFVNDFCVSTTGKTVAYLQFASKNSSRLKLTIMNLSNNKKTSIQGDWQLSGSCFADDSLLFATDGNTLYQLSLEHGIYRRSKVSGKFPLPLGEVVVAN